MDYLTIQRKKQNVISTNLPEGQQFTKLGQKYQLYLRSKNSDKHLPQSPFTGKLFQMTTFCSCVYILNQPMVQIKFTKTRFTNYCIERPYRLLKSLSTTQKATVPITLIITAAKMGQNKLLICLKIWCYDQANLYSKYSILRASTTLALASSAKLSQLS